MSELSLSKQIQKYVAQAEHLESYHVEECDDKTQHWVYAKEGYIFPSMECGTVNGFEVAAVMMEIKHCVTEQEFYGEGTEQ